MKKRKTIFMLLLATSMLFHTTAPEVYACEATDAASVGHNLKEDIYKAGNSGEDGAIVVYCEDCQEVFSKTPIYAPSKVKFPKTEYAYTGKAIKPSVAVYDSNGCKVDRSCYTVTYTNNKEIGTAEVCVSIKETEYYHANIIYANFKIIKTIKKSKAPKATSATSLTNISALPSGFAFEWKKVSGADGYQIQYSTSSNFKNAKNIWVESNSATKNAVCDLRKDNGKCLADIKENKKYYVRVRTFKNYTYEVDGPVKYTMKNGKYVLDRYYETGKICSEWSKKKSITTKNGKIDYNYSAKVSPFPLYTIMYEEDGLPYFYGKWGGSANMDAKNWKKTVACDKKVDEILRILCKDERFSKTEKKDGYVVTSTQSQGGWIGVGNYNGMNVVRRYFYFNTIK